MSDVIQTRNEALQPGEQSGPGGVHAPTAGALPGWRPFWLMDLAWTLPFLILYWLDIAHHQLWFDELNAWGITAASPNLSTLARYVHYEAHPWLWYFVLWLPSRLTTAPVAMKWVEAAIGTASYLVIGLKSPFRRLEKALIFLGYFIIFEYTVMSRMYGIVLLCALLYAWRRTERPQGAVGMAVILGVMASTDMAGVLLSGVLLIVYAYDIWISRELWDHARPTNRQLITAALVYVAFLAVSIHSLIPDPDISWTPGRLFSHALLPKFVARAVVNVIAGPWWPISSQFPRRFWETDFRDQHWLALLVPFILWGYWLALRGSRRALLMVGLALGFAFLFADLVYMGRPRHWGITVLALLLALWHMRAQLNKTAGAGAARRLPAAGYALLAFSAVAGVAAIGSSWTHPFSHSGDVAQWLRANHLADGPIVGNPDVTFASVAEQLQRPVYFMECQCMERFKLFSRERDTFLEQNLADKLAEAQTNLKTDTLIYVCYRQLYADFDTPRFARRGLSATLLATFTGADSYLENYYIYRITKSPRLQQAQ